MKKKSKKKRVYRKGKPVCDRCKRPLKDTSRIIKFDVKKYRLCYSCHAELKKWMTMRKYKRQDPFWLP